MRHKCRKCGKAKDVKEFDRKIEEAGYEIWNLRHCKECTHRIYLKRYEQPKKRRALNRASKNWKLKHPERHAELAREYRKRHPEKIIAQNRLNYAIRMGRIQRKPCEVCGSTGKVHAHHASYDPKDWYNVHWFCYVCHKLEHG